MKYVSTRGHMPPAQFCDILLDGLAPDGGLVVPEAVPTVGSDERERWRGLAYPELAARVIALYATDIPGPDLEALTRAAYSPRVFRSPVVVPLTQLDERTTLVGLSEGPTLAFKDLAMQFLGQVIPYVLERAGRTLNILAATSGDTGSSAEYAFRGKPGIHVFMLSPRGRMSPVQRAQMYALDDPNIHNLAVDGVFDDCQDLVKAITADTAFKEAHALGAVNSINFGRICAQIAYYFWAWLRATDDLPPAARRSQPVSFAVPSGNFGNVYAGHLARRMGLPVRRLIVATNENDVLDEFFRTGVYAPRPRERTLVTTSPSMDISKASNLERLIWEVLGAHEFAARWQRLAEEGRLDLGDHRSRLEDEFGFVSGSSTHGDRIRTIRTLYERTGVVIDPHTADGLAVGWRQAEAGVTTLVMETAKPEKFGDTVSEALGADAPPVPPHIRELLARPQRVREIPDDVATVRAYLAEHALPAARADSPDGAPAPRGQDSGPA